MKIRVLLCGLHWAYNTRSGGTATYCGELADHLAEDCETTLLIPGKERRTFRRNNLRIIELGKKRNQKLSFAYAMKTWALSRDYDIVHFMGFVPAFVFSFLNIFLKKSVVMTVHGYHTDELVAEGRFRENSLGFRFYRFIERRAVQKADAVIAVGKMLGEKALKNKITDVVFDRGGYLYHGRIKALADAVREAGLKF